MPDIDIDVSSSLWSLMLATVMFLAVFVLVSALIPGDAYYPYKEYEKYYPGAEKLSGSDLNMFTSHDNFTATFGIQVGNIYEKTYMSLDLRLHFILFPREGATFIVEHVDARVPIVNWVLWSHYFNHADHTDVVLQDLVEHYDNLTRSSRIEVICSHATLTCVFKSNVTDESVLLAWQNGSPVQVNIDYEVDFSRMGTNIWSILASVFTFQTIKTGVLVIDLLLNSLISVPTYIASGYILYRLITGLIPTVSGGGGN
jgi:hypothetical protein